MLENFRYPIQCGKDCLNPEMVRARVEAKAQTLSGKEETIDIILDQALRNSEDTRYYGPVDPGPITD